MNNEPNQDYRHNYIVNMLDGSFFGFALGFASFSTIIPLFVSQMTSSAVLIGVIPSIHSMGWQLPQLLTARSVSKLKTYKPTVLFMTVQERLPFFGLAVISWFLPGIPRSLALVLTYLCLIWQGLGAGFTANAWQNMIGKIIPATQLGTFFGAQTAASNLLASLGAIAAGFILEKLNSPLDFTLCFLLACGWMVISWIALSKTRENERAVPADNVTADQFWSETRRIFHQDKKFIWFLVTRVISQFYLMAFSFYTVYAVRHHGMDEATAGILTSVLLMTQVIANPLLGWLGDHWNRKTVMELGALAGTLSTLIAAFSQSVAWFFPVVILSGTANTAFWTVGIAMTMEYGTENERPTYIGLANTLIAPVTIIAPILGGWIADTGGYPLTFLTAAAAGLLTVLVFHFLVKR